MRRFLAIVLLVGSAAGINIGRRKISRRAYDGRSTYHNQGQRINLSFLIFTRILSSTRVRVAIEFADGWRAAWSPTPHIDVG